MEEGCYGIVVVSTVVVPPQVYQIWRSAQKKWWVLDMRSRRMVVGRRTTGMQAEQ